MLTNLSPHSRLCFFAFVGLSVCRIAQKVVDELLWNFWWGGGCVTNNKRLDFWWCRSRSRCGDPGIFIFLPVRDWDNCKKLTDNSTNCRRTLLTKFLMDGMSHSMTTKQTIRVFPDVGNFNGISLLRVRSSLGICASYLVTNVRSSPKRQPFFVKALKVVHRFPSNLACSLTATNLFCDSLLPNQVVCSKMYMNVSQNSPSGCSTSNITLGSAVRHGCVSCQWRRWNFASGGH